MERSSTPGGEERGFALLVALLALLVLSILAAAGAFVARSEGRISQSHRAAVAAREIARAGLSEFMSSGVEDAGVRVYVYGRDTAEVTAARLLFVAPDSGRSLLRVTSRGVRTRPGRWNAERTVSTVLLREPGWITPRGAVASGVPVRVPGGAAVLLSGEEGCSDGSAPTGGGEGPAAGLALPPGGLIGDPAVAEGDPAVDDSDPPRVLLRESGFDSARWSGLSSGSLTLPDAVVPAGDWPSDFSGWPVILVEAGSHSLGTRESGRGTIVATGDLAVSGTFDWNGLVLVGGALTVDGGPSTVDGAVVTGIDVHAGGADDTVVVGGVTAVRYDPCAVDSAAARLFGRLVEEPGTRHEPEAR